MMAKRDDKQHQLSFNLSLTSRADGVSAFTPAPQKNTVCLKSYKSDRARTALVKELERSGLVEWTRMRAKG